MREIILPPGASIEIDGVRIRAVEPRPLTGGCSDGRAYDPATDSFIPSSKESDPMLNPESLELLRFSVARWVEKGDLSQAHLLRNAMHEAAQVISILLKAELTPFEVPATPSSPLPADGTRE